MNIIKNSRPPTDTRYPLLYAFTWNPNPSSFVFTEDDPIYLLKEHVRVLNIINHDLEIIVPEFSDHYKLHYHGVVILRTEKAYIDFFRRVKRVKRKGFIKIIKILSLDKWILYCGKTFSTTSKILHIPSSIAYGRCNVDKLRDIAEWREREEDKRHTIFQTETITETDDETSEEGFYLP